MSQDGLALDICEKSILTRLENSDYQQESFVQGESSLSFGKIFLIS